MCDLLSSCGLTLRTPHRLWDADFRSSADWLLGEGFEVSLSANYGVQTAPQASVAVGRRSGCIRRGMTAIRRM